MYKKGIKICINNIIISVLILIGIILLLINKNNINRLIIMTFLINLVLIVSQLFKDSKLGYCMRDIIFIFLSLFMFLAPLIQYLKGKFPWEKGYLITDNMILYSNLIITLFILIYIFMYKVLARVKIKMNFICINNMEILLYTLFVVSCIMAFVIVKNVGFKNIFSRYTNSFTLKDQSLRMVFLSFSQSIPVVNMALNILYIKKNKKVFNKPILFLSSILTLITNWPTGIARYRMASVYLGFILIIKNNFKMKKMFKYIMYAGIIVIFPMLNIFRMNGFVDALRNSNITSEIMNQYVTGNFDAYSMLARIIIYTNAVGIQNGRQLIGNLLFFVPRRIWSSKPIGSGFLVARHYNWSFDNVSCPLIGEGYINFGILGVILFAIILAVITRYADKKYDYLILNGYKKICFLHIIYPFSVGYLFFILRGDLLSALSLYIGFLSGIFFVFLLDKFIFIKKE